MAEPSPAPVDPGAVRDAAVEQARQDRNAFARGMPDADLDVYSSDIAGSYRAGRSRELPGTLILGHALLARGALSQRVYARTMDPHELAQRRADAQRAVTQLSAELLPRAVSVRGNDGIG